MALLFNAAAFATAVKLLCKAAGYQTDNDNSGKNLASIIIRISGALFSHGHNVGVCVISSCSSVVSSAGHGIHSESLFSVTQSQALHVDCNCIPIVLKACTHQIH